MLNNWIRSLSKIILELFCKFEKTIICKKISEYNLLHHIKNRITYILYLFPDTISQLQHGK